MAIHHHVQILKKRLLIELLCLWHKIWYTVIQTDALKSQTCSAFSSTDLSGLPSFFSMFSLLLKELIFIFYLLSLQLVLCRVAALKSGPYIVHSAVYILLLVLSDQQKYSEKSEKNYRFRFIYSKQFELFEPHLDLYQSLYDCGSFKLQFDFLAFIVRLFMVIKED